VPQARHPRARVLENHGSKEALAKSLAAVIARADQTPTCSRPTSSAPRMRSCSSSRGHRDREAKYGNRDKLIAAIGTAEKKSTDRTISPSSRRYRSRTCSISQSPPAPRAGVARRSVSVNLALADGLSPRSLWRAPRARLGHTRRDRCPGDRAVAVATQRSPSPTTRTTHHHRCAAAPRSCARPPCGAGG
jgi:hypothetical protein